MIFLGIPPGARRRNQGRNRFILPPLLADFICNLVCDSLLFFTVGEYGAAIWSPDVAALSVECGGVMHAVEKFEELAVCYEGWVEYY